MVKGNWGKRIVRLGRDIGPTGVWDPTRFARKYHALQNPFWEKQNPPFCSLPEGFIRLYVRSLRWGKKVQWSHQYMKTTQLRVYWSSWQWSLLIDFSSVNLSLSFSIIRLVEFFHSLKKHFATPPLVPSRRPRNERSNSILIPLLIGWNKLSTNQNHYSDLGSDRSSVWNCCPLSSDVISRRNQWWRRKMSVVFAGNFFFKGKLNMYLLRTSTIFIALFTNASSHGLL